MLEFPNASDAKGWLTGFDINREWALRYSGLYHPTGTCSVYCDELDGKWRVNKRFMNPPMVPFEKVHEDALSEGDLEKLGGSKLEGRFQARKIRLADGGKRLEYLQDSDVKGEVPMEKAQVVLVSNDVLTKSKAKKTPKLVEAMEHVNWFGVVGDAEDRVFIFRCQSGEVAERWVVSLVKHASVYANALQGLILTKQEMYKKSTKKRKLAYKGHPLPDSSYPILDRGGTSVMEVGPSDASGGYDESPTVSKSPRAQSVAVPAARGTRGALPDKKAGGSFREPGSRQPPMSSSPGVAPTSPRRSGGRSGSSEPEPPQSEAPKSPRSMGRAAGNKAMGSGPASRGRGASNKTPILDDEDDVALVLGGAGGAASLGNPGVSVATPAAEPASAYARLRTATLSAKAKKAAREEVLDVKKGGGGGPPRPVSQEPPRELKQDAAAAREKERLKKAQERRQKLEQQRKLRETATASGGGGEDDDDNGGGGGGGSVTTSQGSSRASDAEAQRLRAEVEQLRVELEDERAARSRVEAALQELREKAETDKNNARLLKQLARDFKAQAEEAKAEADEWKVQVEELQQREGELEAQFERDLQQAKIDARHEAEQAAGGGGGGVSDAEYEEMVERLEVLQEQLDKAKGDLKTQAREMREQTMSLEKAETLNKQLQDERQLLLDELEESNKMAAAVEDILDLGDPVELMDQLQDLITENEELRAELEECQAKAKPARGGGGGRK